MGLFGKKAKRETRVFFVTDVHGSTRCFLKFINAAKVYEPDVLVLGGDITGKRVVPLVKLSDGSYEGHLAGRDHVLASEDEIAAFEKAAADGGLYAYRTTTDEVKRIEAEPQLVEDVFLKLAQERLQQWLDIADERLADSNVKLIINCGNDDPFELDEMIDRSSAASFAEGRLIDIDERRTLVSCGFANITPWHCQRDVPEDEIAGRIGASLGQRDDDGRQLIFNMHCPPNDSGLDVCPLLTDDMSPVLEGGQPVTGPVGSTAVRDAIEAHQPILSLHGHIHESRCAARLGPTLAINPGSEYPDGVLRGALVDLSEEGVMSYVLTSG
jgi:Icc-related predicted phosphoesterase